MIAIPPPQQIDEENAQFFAASDALARMQRGQKFLALCLSPLPVVIGGICGTFLLSWAFSIDRPVEFLQLLLATAVLGLAVLGTALPFWRMWRNAKRVEAALPLYGQRAVVVTPDYLEVFTGALNEGEREYYISRLTMVVRLPWDAIASCKVRNVRNETGTARVFLIESESLPAGVDGEIGILAAPFEAQEEALVAAIAQHTKMPVRYEI